MATKIGKSSVRLTPEEAVALIAWANEGDRKDGTTAWGSLFDKAMGVAQRVRKALDMEGV